MRLLSAKKDDFEYLKKANQDILHAKNTGKQSTKNMHVCWNKYMLKNEKKNPGLLSGKRPPWEMMTHPQGLSKTALRNLGKLP